MAVVHPEHQKKLDSSRLVLRICTSSRENHKVPDNPIAGKNGYFVLSPNPARVSTQQGTRVTVLEAYDYGIADEQGAGIPEWSIEGQFLVSIVQELSNYGWQRALEDFIYYYLEENKKRGEERKALLRMEYYDDYARKFWIVVPTIVPLGQSDSSHPTIEKYSIRLRGVKPVARPASTIPTTTESALLGSPDKTLQSTCPYFKAGACSLSNCQHGVSA